MIVTNILGGLGNQMFQYAVGKTLSLQNQQKLKFDITGYKNYPQRDFELDIFNIDIDIASNEEINALKQNEVNYIEKYFHYDPKVLELNKSVFLQGYWQSEKYFISYKDEILNDFTLRKELSKQSSQFDRVISSTNSVSIHIRRGDYVNDPTTNSIHGTCNIEYYKNAISLIKNRLKKAHFFIFSDDLAWAKDNLHFINNITFIELDEDVPDYEEMYLMSQCKHNIIANSSFSWWGAWLNQNPDKIVITPEKWFMDETINTKDLIPDSWIRINDKPIITNDLVSIIIPCYNQAQYLEEAVNSTIKQTYPNIEIIIVNDGSTDNTEEIALSLQKKYPKIIKVITQVNKGLSEARNTGIRDSLGEYILPLDADDILELNMLKKSMNAMIHNNADIVYGGLQCFGKKHNIWPSKPFSENNILYQNLTHQCSLYRKVVWIQTKGYKRNMKEGYEDWEFWINAYKHDFTFHFLPEILYYYRIKEESMYTESFKKDAYLKSKIAMNHPELYTIDWVQKAITTINETGELADLYFYHNHNIPYDEKKWFIKVGYFISNNPLKKKQLFIIDEKKIALCTLELLKNHKSIQKLYNKMDVDFLLFYAPLRYEVALLKNSDYAWKKDKGIINSEGSIFPFVFKSIRENKDYQLLAHQRLLRYRDKQLDIQKQHLENKTKAIRKLRKEVEQYKLIQKTIMKAVQSVIKTSIIKSPVKKYREYKSMGRTYLEMKKK